MNNAGMEDKQVENLTDNAAAQHNTTQQNSIKQTA